MATTNFDTFINIIKRPESIRYKSKVEPISANIAYVGGRAVSSQENISIEDKSGFIHSNRIFENEVIDYTDTISLEVKTNNFLITDIYSVSNTSGSLIKTPLFYKHKLKNFTSGETIESVSIKFLDSFKEVFEITDYFLDGVNGIIYTNLESSYLASFSRVDYNFYYVQYTISKSGEISSSYTELLDNEPAYREATIEDYNIDDPISSFLLKATDQVYALEETTGSFIITFSTPRNFSYKSAENRKLAVYHPTPKNYTDPWYLRVSNGKVFHNNFSYRISDEQFFAQEFNPMIGTKKIEKETPTLINKRILKTDYENIHEDSSLGLFIDIRINDKDGDKREYMTTNTGHSDSEYKLWSPNSRLGISSVDHSSGFIEVEGLELDSTDNIECDYYFIENYYELTEIDFNPIRNENILKRRTAIYIDPSPEGNNYTLAFKQFNLDGTSIGGEEPTYQDWSSGTLEGYDSGTGELFTLAEVTVGEFEGLKDCISLDTRVPGGSIKESKVAEVEEKHPEFDSVWSKTSWDGKPYPGNLCYHLQIPLEKVTFESLSDAGDIVLNEGFTPKEVKSIALEHTAAGVWPIIKSYGVETEITSFVVSKNGSNADVKVNWVGIDNFRYKIYYKKTSASSWSTNDIVTAAGTTNKVVEKSQEISNIASNANYYFVVVGGKDINGNFTGLITQHINSSDIKLEYIQSSPDALRALEINIPEL